MKIAIVLGDIDVLSPRSLCSEDFQACLGEEYILFDPSWADLNSDRAYNSDLVLAGEPRLAKASGLAMQCDFLPDQVPLIVLPAYSGEAAEVALISDFLKGVCSAGIFDTLDVVTIYLKSHTATKSDRDKLGQLCNAVSVDGVRMAAPIVVKESFETDDAPYFTNELVRRLSAHLREVLRKKGVSISVEESQLKVMRPLGNLAKRKMAVDHKNVDALASAIADSVWNDLLLNLNRK